MALELPWSDEIPGLFGGPIVPYNMVVMAELVRARLRGSSRGNRLLFTGRVSMA